MKKRIQNRFVADYILMFLISTLIGVFAVTLLSFASDVISKNLVNHNYTAAKIMTDDLSVMDVEPVLANGGGVQVVTKNYEVIFSQGINNLPAMLNPETFTDFLTASHAKGNPYSYSIAYNPRAEFWLVVTFPTSIRIDFAIVHNPDFSSVDTQGVVGVILAIILFYLILLGISTVIYSKLTSLSIINPLKKLCSSASRLKAGDYTSRVDLNLDNEFGELETIFNEMADEIEKEIALRKQSEENRKKLILDISHDLKNPLASIMGYAELCLIKKEMTTEQRQAYLTTIYNNSSRANRLMTDLFELSKIEAPDYILVREKLDFVEYLREQMGAAVAGLDSAGFFYEFELPDHEITAAVDRQQMSRVFENLVDNAISHNPVGTRIDLIMIDHPDMIEVRFKDNGVGIPVELSDQVFEPFVRGDPARSSENGRTGLGLAIVRKVMEAHGGSIKLAIENMVGSEFILLLPKS
ncbi:HAMP domain-containing sensor histidine kinase [Acetobacterium sp.]|uniref:HAMP domain-containing sensor histidine kinase n=1 Tax=Acetobacterium sp. TaxID=1872094 RepID=UPI002720A5FC|nr:HAMP domain-containing sensor histidine kinase [Acetobacterium sp.]MDO9493025.1 HAMP domain-containing sensor histidine kinase [Acetobacterium sp.]